MHRELNRFLMLMILAFYGLLKIDPIHLTNTFYEKITDRECSAMATDVSDIDAVNQYLSKDKFNCQLLNIRIKFKHQIILDHFIEMQPSLRFLLIQSFQMSDVKGFRLSPKYESNIIQFVEIIFFAPIWISMTKISI